MVRMTSAQFLAMHPDFRLGTPRDNPRCLVNCGGLGTCLDFVEIIPTTAAERREITERYHAADREWQAELERRYGKRAGDVRYTREGQGEGDPELARLFGARDRLRQQWETFAFGNEEWLAQARMQEVRESTDALGAALKAVPRV